MNRRFLLFLIGTSCFGQGTTTMIDWNSQVRNRPDLTNPTFVNLTATSVTTSTTASGSVETNAIFISQTGGGATDSGGYIQLAPVTYPNSLCMDQYKNIVNQPVVSPGLPPINATNDAVMWVSGSPLSGATPPGCLQSPFSQQQMYGLNFSTYLFSLVGFSTNRAAYNSFDSLSGGMHAISISSDNYVYPGEFSAPLATGPTDPWRRLSVVNTSGNTVTLVSGAVFFPGMNAPPFGLMTVNGTQYQVSSVTDPQHAILSTSAGTQTAVNAFVVGWGLGAISYSTAMGCLTVYSAGSWACVGGGSGGGASPPYNSVQFNLSGSLTGSSNFAYDSAHGVLSVCTVLGGVCSVNSGVQAWAFSSAATGNTPAFNTNNGLTMIIDGAGDVTPQTLAVGIGPAFTVSNIGDTTLHNLTISGSCTGCNSSPGGSSQQVQFNQTGLFGGNPAFTFNFGSGNLSVCTTIGGICTVTSGFNGQAFSSSATGTNPAFVTNGGLTTIINGAGAVTPQTLAVGIGPAFTVSNVGDTTLHNLTISGTCSGCNSNAAGLNTQIQFNNNSAFGANAAFTFNNGTGVLTVCTVLGGICTTTSGVEAYAFSSSATGTNPAFVTNGGLTTIINGAGAVTPQTLAVGIGPAFTVSNVGDTTLHNLTISGTCSGCASPTAAGSNQQVQYNSNGAFAANAALAFNFGTGNLSVCTTLGGICSVTSGFNGQAFSSSATGTSPAFVTNGGLTTIINGAGAVTPQSLAVGTSSQFTVSNVGDTALHNLTITGTCTGCNSTPAGSSGQVQFNNGGIFGASSSLSWSGTNLSVCASGCGSTAGVNAQAFSSAATGSQAAFVTNGGLTTIINGAGAVTPQTLAVGTSSQFTVGNTGAVVTSSTLNAGGVITGASGYSVTGYTIVDSSANAQFNRLNVGANNGTTATGGLGASVANVGSTISMYFFDTGGACQIGTGVASPGVACSSDERLKENIRPVDSALDMVMNLRPVEYDWRGNGAHGVGFIAQDVRRVIPQLVSEGKGRPSALIPEGNPLMLSQEGLIPYLVRAIQEQEKEIDALKATITSTRAVMVVDNR